MARVDPRSSRWWWLAGLAACACATAGPSAPPRPPPFQGVRSVVLVREVDRAADPRRPRDPLDALEATLHDRGLATRVVEVGPGLRDDLRDVARLVRDVEWRIRSSPPVAAPGGQRPESLGRAPGELLRRLGADAFAVYVRLEGRLGPRVPPPYPGSGIDPRGPPVPTRRTAALALVDRDGALLWFDWGADETGFEPEDDTRVVNAAEAVDQAVRVLAAEPDSDAL